MGIPPRSASAKGGRGDPGASERCSAKQTRQECSLYACMYICTFMYTYTCMYTYICISVYLYRELFEAFHGRQISVYKQVAARFALASFVCGGYERALLFGVHVEVP